MDIISFREDLISWFEREKRDLPWREDKDPYKIWVSEIMLQQTRVDTVIPYFTRFMKEFPTIDSLANADEEKVLKAWEGLGYYSRVRNLQVAVREVQEKYNGEVPNTPNEISALKGVGPYTAGAILSIAYGKPEPAVDGNVMRVLSRILVIWEDIAKAASRKIFEEAVRKLISEQNPSYFNQALMELGALICTPTSPSCLLCPVRDHCRGFETGVQTELPIKSKKKKQRPVELAAVVLTDHRNKLLIRKRPNTGLLANLWEFSNTEVNLKFIDAKTQMIDSFKENYQVAISVNQRLGKIEHVFSHLIWNIHVFSGRLEGKIKETSKLKLVSVEEIKEYAMPVSHQKIFKQYIESLRTEEKNYD
ncbi:A/G-specific adenine glycosylase [Bacillus sp. B15-48]|uniref:A/G-specific adenine glycosylase n=1 Tax=Bacillus sp. B15-48 TaxID=1548601 RepID=UPI0019401A8C|nr:A/G-specific adenine glycosylase [Bacillus sp. B15-48]MBM4765079.1 A/G-specific adenine glycosylase [Bacillus sp. B15-48]